MVRCGELVVIGLDNLHSEALRAVCHGLIDSQEGHRKVNPEHGTKILVLNRGASIRVVSQSDTVVLLK